MRRELDEHQQKLEEREQTAGSSQTGVGAGSNAELAEHAGAPRFCAGQKRRLFGSDATV